MIVMRVMVVLRVVMVVDYYYSQFLAKILAKIVIVPVMMMQEMVI